MQKDNDKYRISELIEKFTGIQKEKIYDYIIDNRIDNIFEHPSILKVPKKKIKLLSELVELRNIYNNLQGRDRYKINSTTRAGEYFINYFKDKKDKEYIVCGFLDNRNNIIETKCVAEGTINESKIYPRDVIKEAIMCDSRHILLSHNHPGGCTNPSTNDIEFTNNLNKTLKNLNLHLLDHIIVGNDNYYSFAEEGKLRTAAMDILMMNENALNYGEANDRILNYKVRGSVRKNLKEIGKKNFQNSKNKSINKDLSR